MLLSILFQLLADPTSFAEQQRPCASSRCQFQLDSWLSPGKKARLWCSWWNFRSLMMIRGCGGVGLVASIVSFWPHGTVDRVLASRPAALGSILIIPEFFWTHLSTAQTVQSLVVNQTHLLLVSGQLVLQKNLTNCLIQVAVQREEDEPPRNPMNTSDYETQAINILNKPRKG